MPNPTVSPSQLGAKASASGATIAAHQEQSLTAARDAFTLEERRQRPAETHEPARLAESHGGARGAVGIRPSLRVPVRSCKGPVALADDPRRRWLA